METAQNKIDSLLTEATNIAIDEVTRLAMNVLKKVKIADEFVMAMGTFFFIDKEGENIWDTEMENYRTYRQLRNFICANDHYLCITGTSIRFKQDGSITRNW